MKEKRAGKIEEKIYEKGRESLTVMKKQKVKVRKIQVT